MSLSTSPFADITLAEFAARFRRGEISAHDTTVALLTRIETLQPRLRAFTFVDPGRALAQAAGIDRLRSAGVDLGPLMGVPVALKDLFTVTSMPTTAGSRMDVSDLVPPQGRFVTLLERGGCILLGKTATTEFAMGGFNLREPPPWNPCDTTVPRMTGGSSHGSAVAMAAQLAGFTLGSDTGGSVRWPAALCGVTGYKTTKGHWPLDGVFPLSHSLDSLGCFTRSVADAAYVEAAIAGETPRSAMHPEALVLALPGDHFFQNVDADVRACFDRAVARLRTVGARMVEIATPEAGEIDEVFGPMLASEWLAFVGRERFLANEALMDAVPAARARAGLDVRADDYVRLASRQRALVAMLRERSRGIDAWITPTVAVTPAPCAEFRSVAAVAAWNRLNTQNTRPGNLFGQCGVSLPIHHLGAPLPVGLQLCGAPGSDAHLLAVAQTVEAIVGCPPALSLDDWLSD